MIRKCWIDIRRGAKELTFEFSCTCLIKSGEFLLVIQFVALIHTPYKHETNSNNIIVHTDPISHFFSIFLYPLKPMPCLAFK